MSINIIKIFLFIVLSINLYATDAQEIQELREQVKMILKKIDTLDKKVMIKAENRTDTENVSLKNIEIVKKEEPKSKDSKYIMEDASGQNAPVNQKGFLELKTANTVLSVGGRIQMDTHYSWPEGSHSAKGIPIANTPGENGHMKFDSKYSRLWVKTRTPSQYGPIRVLIETDFSGVAGTETNTNSSGLRLRHAYVQAGNWTVGQTNSAFNSYVTLDILYTAINDIFARQPLLRYTVEGDRMSYDISFEQPETTLLDPDGNIIKPKDDVIPDIVARLRYYPTWGELGFSLMGRYINQDQADITVNGTSTTLNNGDGAFGWAANLTGKVKVFEKDDIRFAAHYGEGLGRYISYNAYAAGSIDLNGKIKLQPSFGGHIGYRHFWNDKLRSTVSFSYAGTKNNLDSLTAAANLATINKNAYSSQINLVWTPIPNSLIGIEYVKAKRKVESDEQGDLDTAMLRLRYDF